jgi:hypothetical protein
VPGISLPLSGIFTSKKVLLTLQEALEAGNQEVIFYPKFHCELNFVEQSGVQRNGIHKSIVITHWMACGRVFQLLSIPLRLRR